jgi:hypothetical protein
MRRFLLIFSLTLIAFSGKAQLSCPTEHDPLSSKVIFVFKGGATPAQLNTIKTEFAKYPQISKATYIYTSLNYLLVDLNMSISNPNFSHYDELIKIMCGAFNKDNILIKTPAAYEEISGQIDAVTFTVK